MTEFKNLFDCIYDEIPKTKEGWLSQRRKGIGGSDAGIIEGVNRYTTLHELWEDKTGRQKRPQVSNHAIEMGNRLEPVMFNLFEALYGDDYEVIDTKDYSLSRKDKEWMRANLDGALIRKEDGSSGILEIKSTTINKWQYFQEEWGDDSMPQTYYCQCLHYMNVTGAEFVVLFAIAMMPWCDETKTIIRRIERSEVFLDLMQLEADEEAFWQKHIVEDIEPNFL